MFERFTRDARATVIGAQEAARRLAHPVTGTQHLLVALFASGGGVDDLLRAGGLTADGVEAAIVRLVPDRPGSLGPDDAAALRAIGIDLDEVRARIEENFGPVPPPPAPAAEPRRWRFGLRRCGTEPPAPRVGRHRPFTPRAKKVLELSLRESLRLKSGEIASEHILLGLLREGNGLAARVLADAGVDVATLRSRAEAALRSRSKAA